MSHRTSIAFVVTAMVVAAAVGPAVASAAEQTETDVQLDGEIDSREEAVLFARNVDEVKGHLRASIRLAGNYQPEEVQFHADHAYTDYWNASSPRGPLQPAIASANESLASELETKLASLDSKATSLSPTAYERYVREEVFPLLDRALDDAIPSEYRESEDFDADVTVAVLDRIEGEYAAGINESGAVASREGYWEYWDARGFIVQASERYEGELAPTFGPLAHTQVEESFTELQANASRQASPSELTAITADLRSTLSNPGEDESAFEDLLELFATLLEELSDGTTDGSS
jgi:hypothetical protein